MQISEKSAKKVRNKLISHLLMDADGSAFESLLMTHEVPTVYLSHIRDQLSSTTPVHNGDFYDRGAPFDSLPNDAQVAPIVTREADVWGHAGHSGHSIPHSADAAGNEGGLRPPDEQPPHRASSSSFNPFAELVSPQDTVSDTICCLPTY